MSFQQQPATTTKATRRFCRLVWLAYVWHAFLMFGHCPAGNGQSPTLADASALSRVHGFLSDYCLECHHAADQAGKLALEDALDRLQLRESAGLDTRQPDAWPPIVWERIIQKLRTGQMPPADAAQPESAERDDTLRIIETFMDTQAAERPRPGRTDSLRRMNRTEYQNAIRDLLAVPLDAGDWLPEDQSSLGFDNVTVGDLSPTLLGRYLTAAQRISAIAVGAPARQPLGTTVRVRPDKTQEGHVAGLPWGTRGGTLFQHYFPQSGLYEFQIRLTRDRNEEIEGLREPHELQLLVDSSVAAQFTVSPPDDGISFQDVDSHLTSRVALNAGPHDIGITFVQNGESLLETKRQPTEAHFNMHRHPRQTPAIFQVSLVGPFDESSSASDHSPSRRRIFGVDSSDNGSAGGQKSDDDLRAAAILRRIARRAYRREITEEDLQQPLNQYRRGYDQAGFEAGIQAAISVILVNPQFLFRIERDPPGLAPQTAYPVSDVELASRLSFFLWSSLPDDELLDAAVAGQLRVPSLFSAQVRRLLADSRAYNLVTNFAAQWLYLRNLDSFTPDLRSFPDFDDNLRQAMRAETELFFASIVTENRSVLDLLSADYTYLNERLAKHYGMPHVYGDRFRRVSLGGRDQRGGLLRHASILSVTSYATRTSPVLRGHWILKNLVGDAPPPPPPDVPALDDNTVAANLTVRERLAMHRANAACASCHDRMDPVGLALENYDAIGRWRDREAGEPISGMGSLPDGTQLIGVAGVEQVLLERPELFVATLAEKLLTFALGRGITEADAPAIRQIVRESAQDNYRFGTIIFAITRSVPFQMRTTP